jgi:hypothetical protein
MKKSIVLLFLGIFGMSLVASCTTGTRNISSIDPYPLHSINEREHERQLTNGY